VVPPAPPQAGQGQGQGQGEGEAVTTPAGDRDEEKTFHQDMAGGDAAFALQSRVNAKRLNWTEELMGDTFGQAPSGGAGPGTCYVANADELREAVDNRTECRRIFLTNATADAYQLDDELNITRPVTISGHPVVLPQVRARHIYRTEIIHMPKPVCNIWTSFPCALLLSV
jgi:hypothetical protein